MDYDYIVDIFEQMNDIPSIPKTNALKDGTIIDEDKSVKWNREQVELSKIKYKEELQEIIRKRNEIFNKGKEETIKYIKENLDADFSDEKCEIIWNRAYVDGHAYGFREIMGYVDDYIDFVNDLLS